jgi:hypothetical protein
MADIPNYNATNIIGTSWQRAYRVIIENPYLEQPNITFAEEKIYNIDGKAIKESCANVSCGMDPSNPLHLELYIKLNELYTILRELRDTPTIQQPVMPVDIPQDPPPIIPEPIMEP